MKRRTYKYKFPSPKQWDNNRELFRQKLRRRVMAAQVASDTLSERNDDAERNLPKIEEKSIGK